MKKLLSLVLCVIILLGVFSVSSSAKENTVPFVLVSGMDVLPLYKDYGTENEQKVWGLTGDSIKTLGKDLIKPLMKLCVNRNRKEFGISVLNALDNTFEYIKCDDNGNSLYNISTPRFSESLANYEWVYSGEEKDEQGILNAAVKKYGADNVYFFNYDWRLDPLTHADDLNSLIESIKKEKSCDKVNLACCSMGGVVSMSYLYKYGHDSINNFILLSTAFQGVTAVADMYEGKLYLDKDMLIRRVINLGKGDVKEFLFKALMFAVDESGVADSLVDYANEIINSLKDDIYDILLKDIFGKMPGILDLISSEEYEASKKYMLDFEKNKAIIKRCDEYIYCVQSKAKEILDSAKTDGVGVYNVCQYNMQALPVSKSGNKNNDLLIDVKYASGGAYCADLDCVLSNTYKQVINDGHNHISSDRVIDASTCMYPDNTWFIKDQAHVDYNVGPSTDFIFWLADSDTQYTVFDSENYPQFMIYDYDDNSLNPVKEETKKSFDIFSFLSRISDFFKYIFGLFKIKIF